MSTDLVHDTSLPDRARFLWLLIKSFQGKSGSLPFPKVETLAFYMNATDETVAKYLNILEKGGRIRRVKVRSDKGVFLSNRYELIEPRPYRKNSGMEPYPEKPSTVNPCMDNPSTVNPGTISSPSVSVPQSNQSTNGDTRHPKGWRQWYRDDSLEAIDLYNRLILSSDWKPVTAWSPKLQEVIQRLLKSGELSDIGDIITEAIQKRARGESYTGNLENKFLRILVNNF